MNLSLVGIRNSFVPLCILLSLSPSLFALHEGHKGKKSDPQDIQHNLYEKALSLFREHDFDIREAADLDAMFTPLDCSGFSLRQLHPGAWSRPAIRAQDDQIMLLYKGGKYILVEGGPNMNYQPIFNTELKLKFSRGVLEEGPQTYRKHTLVVIKQGKIGIAKKQGKYIILEQGFHWLKNGEIYLEAFGLSDWLERAKYCDIDIKKRPKSDESSPTKDLPRCVIHQSIGETGYVLEKVIVYDPNELLLRMKHDGTWVVLKPGLNIYPPQSAPVGEQKVVAKSLFFSTEEMSVADTGYKVKTHFSISVPSEKEYNQLIKDQDAISYAEFLLEATSKGDHLSWLVIRTLQSILKTAAKEFAGNDFSINEYKKATVAEFLAAIKGIATKEQQSSKLIVSFRDLEIIDEDIAEHESSMGKERRQQERNALKRKQQEQDVNFELESEKAKDALAHARADKTHKHKMEELTLKHELEMAQIRAERVKAKAKLTKAKAKEKKAKTKKRENQE